MKRLALSFSIVVGIIFAAAAQTDPDRISATAKFSQSEAVRARFPGVDVGQLIAPSFGKPAPALTTQAEMEAFLEAEIAPAATAALLRLGSSAQGRAIPAVLLTATGARTLDAARALGRPVVWFIGQQHGNEPAGGEAMLALAHRLARGPLAPMLSTMTVVIVPRANPDGAATDRRGVASGADPNRDHILLTLDETRAIHAAMQALPPDVVFDHHEFSVANRWVEKFGGVQKADAMLLAATHPMIAPDIRAMGDELFLSRAEAAMKARGLTPLVYLTTSYSRKDPIVATGGSAPGIARNAFGLIGAISYLVETRGVGVGLESWQRRVATHVVIAEAVLGAVRDGGAPLVARLRAARQAVARSAEPLPVTFKVEEHPFELPLVDPATGEDKIAAVKLSDSRRLTVTGTRERALAYLVTADVEDTARRLAMNGVASCRLETPARLVVDSYAIAAPPRASNREAINPEQTVAVEIARGPRDFPPGVLVVPMSQQGAGAIAAALEPDSAGSLVGVGLLPIEAGVASVHRAPVGAAWPPGALGPGC